MQKRVRPGELVNELLSEKKKFGTKYFYLGSPESEEVILNLKEYQKVDHPKDAVEGVGGVVRVLAFSALSCSGSTT